jgi:hypothetical protein
MRTARMEHVLQVLEAMVATMAPGSLESADLPQFQRLAEMPALQVTMLTLLYIYIYIYIQNLRLMLLFFIPSMSINTIDGFMD